MKLRYLVPITFALSALMFWADLYISFRVMTGVMYLLVVAAFPYLSRDAAWSWIVTAWCNLLMVLDLIVDPKFVWGTQVGNFAVTNRTILAIALWCTTGLMLYTVRVQRKLAERELELRRHMVEMAHTNRLTTVGQMVVELTHEINQPLYAISNFAKACLSMLKENTPDNRERALHWMHQIAEQARRAGEIIRRHRQFVQSDSPVRTPADVNDIVRDVIQLLEMDPRLRGVQIVTDVSANSPPIQVDRIQIEQVLVNLLVNAAEAMHDMPKENRKITVATRTLNGHIDVAVRDAGCGLPPATLGRLFEPYFSTKPDGMGMGLPISRSLIEDHGGRLWAEPNPDRGLTFRFSLPISDAMSAMVNQPIRLKAEETNA